MNNKQELTHNVCSLGKRDATLAAATSAKVLFGHFNMLLQITAGRWRRRGLCFVLFLFVLGRRTPSLSKYIFFLGTSQHLKNRVPQFKQQRVLVRQIRHCLVEALDFTQ